MASLLRLPTTPGRRQRVARPAPPGVSGHRLYAASPAGAQRASLRAPALASSSLSPPESTALAGFRAASAPDPDSAAARLLRQAGTTRDADGDAVLGALAHALTSPTPLPGAAPASPSALVGRPWRLVFSSPAPLPAWRFIPVPEFFALPPTAAGGGPVCLSSDVGPLHFAFSGGGRFLESSSSGGAAGDDAVLEFCFTRADVAWGSDAPGPFLSRPLGDASTKPKKTYTFFAYLPAGGDGGVEVVGARSSGGALSLLARRRV